MKIAIYYNIPFSGATRVVMEHVNGLRELGNTVDVYTLNSEEEIFDPGKQADNVYEYKFSPTDVNIPVLKRIKKDFYDTFFILRVLHKKIASEIDEGNYDIVLVHLDIKTQAPFLLRYLKTLNVYFCLEPLRNAYEYSLRLSEEYSVLNRFYEKLNRWMRKKIDRENTLASDHILSLSLFGRERIISSYDLYPDISYLGVDELRFKPLNLKERNQILFVADKFPIYGYDLAKKAMSYIPKNIRPELKVISWKKNNSQRLSDEDLVKTYNQSIVTLSLSKFDTFGLVPLESMACGVPVIALNVAGYREIVLNTKTGYLTEFDPKEIAQKIISLISNPGIRREMGRAGRKWVIDSWTWRRQIIILNKLLIKYIHKNK